MKSIQPKEAVKCTKNSAEFYREAISRLSRSLFQKTFQALDGDVPLRTLTYLLDHGVIGLPLHDATAVNTEHVELAKKPIELAWLVIFQSEFLPKFSTK